MSKPFEPSRADGRSDRQVIYDLTHRADAGDLFSYDQLCDALAEGLESRPGRERVYRAVAAANKTLLREHRRYLNVVKGEGYRMLRADEHLTVALTKKDTAQGYIRKGISLLRHARLEELDDAQRTLHEGQLIIMAGLYRAVQDSEARHDRQEKAIDEIRKRLGMEDDS